MTIARFLWPMLLSVLILLSACTEDPEAAANELFVEASTALNKSKDLEPETKEALEERSALLTLAMGNLDLIVSDYPSSSLAVDLAASGEAKGIKVSEIKAEVEATSQALFCIENPTDGTCGLNLIVTEEAKVPANPKRKSSVAALLAANGRFDEALAFTISAKASRDVEFGAMSMALFAVLLDEPKGEELAKTAIPPDKLADAELFILDLKGKLKDKNWKRASDLAPSAAAPEAAGEVTVEEAFSGLGELLVAGDMEKVRLQMIAGYMAAKSAAGTTGDEGAFEAFQDGFVGELDLVFN